MLYRTNRCRSWPLLGLLGAVALSAQACDSGDKVTISNGTGGSTGGTPAATAGAPGSDTGGSSTSSTGGSTTGGHSDSSDTAGDAGTANAPDNGGSGGTGGTGGTVPEGSGGVAGTPGAAGSTAEVTCATDKQCQAYGQLCDVTSELCVDCLSNEQCEDGELCYDGECRTGNSCASTADCANVPDDLAVCDMSRGECVECVESADCGENSECIDRRCVDYVPCEESRDCPAGIQVCNVPSGRCVDCNVDADCLDETLTVCAPDGTCHAACSTETPDCSSVGGVCDRSEGYCVECRSDTDCAASEHCQSALCVPDLCNPGDTMCDDNGVAECNEAGNGFGRADDCESGQTCTAVLSRATCETPGQQGAAGAGGQGGGATATGGAQPEGGAGGTGNASETGGAAPTGGTGGTSPTGGAAGSDETGGNNGEGGTQCATGASPCDAIPAFTGTQDVDGNDDEFCDIPSFVLDFDEANSAKVNDWRQDGRPLTESALARVGWSETGLHVFVTVADSAVHPWQDSNLNLWHGDGIEVMLTTTANPDGDVAADSGALHVAATYEEAVSVASGTPAALPSAQQAGKLVPGGYAIELQLPWPDGGDALESGSTIRFELTLNAANAEEGDTWRDAQAILTMSTGAPEDSTCGDDVQPHCDNRVWCATDLE